MIVFFQHLYAYLSVLPFLTYIGIWFLLYTWSKDKKHATIRAMDVTMIFLIGAVSALLEQVLSLGMGGLWLILLIMLISVGLLGNAQQRTKGKVDVVKAIRVVWRIGFMILFILYLLLLIIGLIQYIAS